VEVAAARCPVCGTVLVPRLEWHWFLAMEEIQAAAADAIRTGQVQASPPAAADELTRRAGPAPDWCVSQRLWVGEPVPAARCRDCDQVAVAAEPASSCGRCMGDLVPDDKVMDARFMAWVVPLAAAGWPAGGPAAGEDGKPSLLVVPQHHLADVLPTVGVGLRLTGTVPFDQVAVAPAAEGGGSVTALRALVDEVGPQAARLALLCGGGDVAGASRVLADLEATRPGPADVDRLEAGAGAAFAAGTPAAALNLLTAVLAEGIPPGDLDRVRALAAPFVGP
jgi:hypothetical protein